MSYYPNTLYDPSWLLWNYPPPPDGGPSPARMASQAVGNGATNNGQSQSPYGSIATVSSQDSDQLVFQGQRAPFGQYSLLVPERGRRRTREEDRMAPVLARVRSGSLPAAFPPSPDETTSEESTPDTEHSSIMQNPTANPAIQQDPNQALQGHVQDIRNLCRQSRSRVKALSDAVSLQPGMPAVVINLLNNDLRIVAEQLVAIAQTCNTLQSKLDQQSPQGGQVLPGTQAELQDLLSRLQNSEDQVRMLQKEAREMEQGMTSAEKRRKEEFGKKEDKISNQKRRIREQQEQIENLKKKTGNSNGTKGFQTGKPATVHSPSSEDDVVAPAASEIDAHKNSRLEKPKNHSTLNGKDEEFLINNLKKMNLEHEASADKFVLPSTGTTHTEHNKHTSPGGPLPNPYGHFGVAPLAPMGGSSGPVAPYGSFAPMGPYGHMTNYQGHAQGHPAYYHQYAPHPHPAPAPARDPANAATKADMEYLNAVVLHRDENPYGNVDVKIWKDLLNRHFSTVLGWTEKYCKGFIPGAAAEATKTNPRLWDYMLKVAYCPTDPQASAPHALAMLDSPNHRCHFIARMVLQYLGGEMLTWRFWLEWEDETDVQLKRIGAVIDSGASTLEQRRSARRELRKLIEGIVKDEEWPRFRSFKNAQHVNRLKGIAGPFIEPTLGAEGALGLHSLCNVGAEVSHKMLTSRLAFGFTWNECGVKFSRDQHIAINSDENPLFMEQRHARIALVVSPGITVRDDTSSSITPLQVCKAQVLVMN